MRTKRQRRRRRRRRRRRQRGAYEDEVVEWEDEDELVESHLYLTYPPLLATWLPTRALWRWRRKRIDRRGWRGDGGGSAAQEAQGSWGSLCPTSEQGT
jgi:hypothetical protein